jgi:hypothetical protein
MNWLLRLSLTKVFGENIISFQMWNDFYTGDLKKYWLKLHTKIPESFEHYFILTDKLLIG